MPARAIISKSGAKLQTNCRTTKHLTSKNNLYYTTYSYNTYFDHVRVYQRRDKLASFVVPVTQISDISFLMSSITPLK